MKRLLGKIVVGLCACLFLAATASGSSLKSVYLKDGGVIECVSFWKKDGLVMVRVNRDVLVDLANEEVDMTRTFAKKPVKPRKKKARIAKKVLSAVSGAPVVAVPPAAKPGAASAVAVQPPAKTGVAPAIAVQPAAKPGAAPAVAVQPAAKTGAAAVVAAQPPAKSGAASAAASAATPPQVKAQADAKPSLPSADAPTRKTLPLIVPKPPAPANAALAGLLSEGLVALILLGLVIIAVSFWKISARRAKRPGKE